VKKSPAKKNFPETLQFVSAFPALVIERGNRNYKRRKLLMKRQISIFAGAFVALIWACTPAQAQYLGCLQSVAGYTMEVQSTTKVAHTMMLVTSKGRLDVEMIRLFDPDNIGGAFEFPRNADRVIMMFEAPIGQSAVIRISQGTSRFEFTAAPHAVAVIDLSPGPLCGGR
jgi:hypothetical protein